MAKEASYYHFIIVATTVVLLLCSTVFLLMDDISTVATLGYKWQRSHPTTSSMQVADPPSYRRMKQASANSSSSSSYKKYIVILHPPPEVVDDNDALLNWYQSFLPSNLTDSGKPRITYTYVSLWHGFNVWLTKDEHDAMSKKLGFVRSWPNEMRFIDDFEKIIPE